MGPTPWLYRTPTVVLLAVWFPPGVVVQPAARRAAAAMTTSTSINLRESMSDRCVVAG